METCRSMAGFGGGSSCRALALAAHTRRSDRPGCAQLATHGSAAYLATPCARALAPDHPGAKRARGSLVVGFLKPLAAKLATSARELTS